MSTLAVIFASSGYSVLMLFFTRWLGGSMAWESLEHDVARIEEENARRGNTSSMCKSVPSHPTAGQWVGNSIGAFFVVMLWPVWVPLLILAIIGYAIGKGIGWLWTQPLAIGIEKEGKEKASIRKLNTLEDARAQPKELTPA